MGLSSVFQILRLATGPSLVFTSAALHAGRYFREVLLGVPHHENNRLIIELLGNFARSGKAFQSDQALLAGLGGYIQGETRMSLAKFYDLIKREGGVQILSRTWPLSPASDVVYNLKSKNLKHPNTIRFHVLSSDNRILLQAEYTITSDGQVFGPGAREPGSTCYSGQIESLEEVLQICRQEGFSLADYVYRSEESNFSVKRSQAAERMTRTWQIMNEAISNGLQNKTPLPASVERQAPVLFGHFKEGYGDREPPGKEYVLAGIYAVAVAEESAANHLIITAPVCETAGILASVLKVIQARFRLPDDRMSSALMVAGFTGSLLVNQYAKRWDDRLPAFEFKTAAAMTAAATASLLSNEPEAISRAVYNAMKLSGSESDHAPENLPFLNLKYAQMAFSAANLAVLGYGAKSGNLPHHSSEVFQI